MARDYAAIMGASQQTQTAITRNEVISLPPGYLVGFDVRLRPDYTVLIYAGAANVGGSLVKKSDDHLVADADWVVPKVDSKHYYIYLTKAGAFEIDLIAPTWNSDLLYYEHPLLNHRAIGKLFYVTGSVIFAIKEVEKTEQTVTVAPDGFTGKADYYCIHDSPYGENDQILINAAIRYLHEAYDGGTINLLAGTFYLANYINQSYSNISISGVGAGTSIDCSLITGSYIVYASGVSNLVLTNMKISQAATWGAIYYNSITDLMVYNLIIDGETTDCRALYGIYSTGCSNTKIFGNSIKSIRKSFAIAYYGMYLDGNNNAIVNQNHIYDLYNSGGGSIAGIYLNSNRSSCSENRIEAVNSTSPAGAQALSVAGSNVKVTNNYCYNNGSDAGIANTNGNNFYDAGTDTQVYSNSWQQPVAGEPSLGELKFQSRTTILSAVTVSASQSYTIGPATSGIPTGCNMIYLEVYGRPSGNCIMDFGPTTTNNSGRHYNWSGNYVSDHLYASVSTTGDFKIWNPSSGDWLFFYAFGRGYKM